MPQKHNSTTTETTIATDINKDWELFLSKLPENLMELAIEHDQIPPKSATKAKILDPYILLKYLFYYVLSELSLSSISALSPLFGGPSVSKEAISLRLRRAVPFLQALLRSMLNSKKHFEVERWAGYEVLALDGSSIVGYGSKKTDARLHYSIQLSDLSVKNILVTTESTGETFRNIIPQKDQLYIADRGYSNPVGISHIVSHGADVLVRLNFGSLPLYKTHLHSELLELDKKLGEISFGETKEYRCCIKARNFEPVWGRVIAFRLDDEKAKKAQERIRSSKKVKNKKLAMERAKFILVFTTVPSDRLSKEALIELYRLRWQVELEIKRSKSLGKVDKLRCKHLESIQAWLLLNLLYQEMLKSLLDEPLQENEVPTEELEVRNQQKREAIWARFALGSLILRASLCPIRLHDFLERRAEIEKILRKDQRYRKRVLSVDKTLALLGEIMSI